MFRKLIAAWLAVAAVFIGSACFFIPEVRADEYPKVTELRLLDSVNLAERRGNQFYKIVERDYGDSCAYLETEEVLEYEDWNFAFYPDEFAVEFRNCNFSGCTGPWSFFKAYATQRVDGRYLPYPVKVRINGKNSLNFIRSAGYIPFAGQFLAFEGVDGENDALELKYTEGGNTPFISSHIGLSFENLAISLEADFEKTASETFNAIVAQNLFSATDSSISIKVEDAKGRGIVGIQARPEVAEDIYAVTFDNSTYDFELKNVANSSSGLFIYHSVLIDNGSKITGVITTATHTYTTGDIYGIRLLRSVPSSDEVELKINQSEVDLSIGNMNREKEDCRVLTLQGIQSQDKINIYGHSDIKISIGGAMSRRTGLETDYLEVEDSNIDLDLTSNSWDLLTAGIFTNKNCFVEGECGLNIEVPYVPRGSKTSAALHCLGDGPVNAPGVVFGANMLGNSVFNLGGEGMAVDDNLTGGKIFEFFMQDHSELTLSCNGGIVTGDGINVRVSAKNIKSKYPFTIYQGDSIDSLIPVAKAGSIDWTSKCVHIDAHVYDDCDDTACNVCGRKRHAQKHEFDEGKDTCRKCGFIRKVEISGLHLRGYGEVEEEVTCNLDDSVASFSVRWKREKLEQHSETYSATVKVTPKDGYFFRNTKSVKTKVILNGEEVPLQIDENGDLIITASFTRQAPTRTPTPEPTDIPSVTPTVSPKPTAGPTKAVSPTSAPTSVPTPTEIPPIAPTVSPKPTVEPTKSVTPTTAPTSKPSSAPSPTGIPPIAPTVTTIPEVEPTKAVTPTSTPAPTTNPAVSPVPGTPTPGQPTVLPTPGKPTVTPTPGKPTSAPEKEPTFEDFVERLYEIALNRISEAAGKAFWIEKVISGEFNGADCARFFLLDAPEFMNRNLNDEDFVETLYRTFFDRQGEPDGKAFWLKKLEDGMSKAEVVNNFIESTEWCNVCATYGVRSGATSHKSEFASKNAINFASRLYTCCLGRESEEKGLLYWSMALTNLEQTGCSAAKLFFTGEEFENLKLQNDEYITRLYQTFMGREPSKDEIAFWVGEIEKGTQTRYSTLEFFGQSAEFSSICKKYAIEQGKI